MNFRVFSTFFLLKTRLVVVYDKPVKIVFYSIATIIRQKQQNYKIQSHIINIF